jgi:Glyoxalase-like domain
MKLTATVLDAPDPRELAGFYQRLLGWPVGTDEPGAEFQPQEDVRVYLDPAGHPFCLYVAG